MPNPCIWGDESYVDDDFDCYDCSGPDSPGTKDWEQRKVEEMMQKTGQNCMIPGCHTNRDCVERCYADLCAKYPEPCKFNNMMNAILGAVGSAIPKGGRRRRCA